MILQDSDDTFGAIRVNLYNFTIFGDSHRNTVGKGFLYGPRTCLGCNFTQQ